MIPISTDTPIRRTPWVNYGIIAVNVLIFVITGGVTKSDNPNSPWHKIVGLAVLDGYNPQLFQFFTYQFLHADWGHIIGNMLFLWIFGNPVNAKMGHGPYLCFYLAGGIFAAVGYGYSTESSMVGASGAIAAVTTAYLALFPRSHITILYWYFIIGTFELPSIVMIVFKMIVWDNILAPSLFSNPMRPATVAFGAHLAGYAFGFAAAAGMLALRFLPRDQFDIVALWRRRIQRSYAASVMADPNAEAQLRYGRVARPVMVDGVTIRPLPNPTEDQVADIRMRIAEALSQNNRDLAAELYDKLLEIDTRQVLGRQQQLDVANQLCTLNKVPQAAAAYEKFLSYYPNSPEAIEVKLLLGIIYARDLHQFEVAEGHLRQVLEKLTDERRRGQAQHWLDKSLEAMGRGEPGAETPPSA